MRTIISTEIKLPDRYADRRILSIDEVNTGDVVEFIPNGKPVRVLYKNHDYLEVKPVKGQIFIRKVGSFARIEASQEGL